MRWSKENSIVIVFFILHLVGAVGLMFENIRSFFLFLTPFNLLVSFALLLWGNMNFSFSFIKVISILFLMGYFVEVLGVKTGLLFGEYSYGPTLGLKFFDVPLLIGVNWVLLALSCYAVSTYFTSNSKLQPLLSALLMVFLDVMIEPVAINLDYWQWKGGHIPFQNYCMWFVVSILMSWLISFNRLKFNAKLGFGLLVSLILFFTIQSFNIH